MKTMIIIYLFELFLLISILTVTGIIFKLKKKEGFLKLSGLVLVVFLILLVETFIVERPQISMKHIESVEAKSGKVLESPKTTYHFKDITDKVKINGDIDYNKVGEYDIQFEVDTILGKYKKSNKVQIVDTTAPELTIEEGEDYNQSYSKEYKEPGYKAIDTYDGDITDKVEVLKEEIDELHYNIKYKIIDTSGNMTEKIRKVTIVDDIPPVITLNGESTVYVYIGGKYTENGAKAVDEKEGDLTANIKIEGTVDTNKIGNYKIIYKVSDSKGNEGVATRSVVVYQRQMITAASSVANGSSGGNGVVYLTFDDGPSTSITPGILDILKRKNVKATFFILNYGTAGETLVKREIAEGHTVGIHGYSHDYKQIYTSDEDYMNNITQLQSKLINSIGYNTTITRFPGGSSNTVSRNYNKGIMTRLTKLVVERGYKYFDWNVSSGDAGGARSANDVYNNVVSGLSKSRQNVVLMHDFSGNYKTLNALERIIDYGISNGYTFLAINNNTPMVTHTPNN